jgi:hypothetical protein
MIWIVIVNKFYVFLLKIRADEEQALDNDISYEFHRESHHIHSIPRTEISQVLTVLFLPYLTSRNITYITCEGCFVKG